MTAGLSTLQRQESTTARSFSTPRVRVDAPALAAVVLGAAFFVTCATLAISGYTNFRVYYRDLGIYENVLWNTAHGRPFATTLLLKNTSHLAEHVAPVLLALAPLYRLLPDPRWLILLHLAALTLAGAPIYLLARRRLASPWAGVLVLAAFYLTPSLSQVIALNGFYPVALTTVPLTFAAYFILADRPRRGALVACSTLLLEETSALALLGIGLLLLARRQTRLGLAVAGVAAAWLALVALVVMPAFRPPGVSENRVLHKFDEVLTDPRQAWTLLAQRGPDAAAWLLLPTAGLPLLAPRMLIASLPTVGVLLFQTDDTVHSHRITPVIPLLWLGAAEGLAALRGGRPRLLGLALLVLLTGASYIQQSDLPGGGSSKSYLTQWDERSEARQRAVAAVPAEAAVAAAGNIVVHLANRDAIWIANDDYSKRLWPTRRLDWYVLDLNTPEIREEVLSDRRSPLHVSPPYALWLPGEPVLVATDHPPQPRIPSHFVFSGVLHLDGYDAQRSARGVEARLSWRLDQAIPWQYIRRLEVIASDSAVLASQDGPWIRGFFGPSHWKAGQIVVEDVQVPLEANALLAATRLRLSWIDPATGQPLLLADGARAVELELSW